MKQSFDELPDWIFDLEEVSANVYEVTGTDRFGRRVQMKGINPDKLLDDARNGAIQIQGGPGPRVAVER
jgi:hypothetical protein